MVLTLVSVSTLCPITVSWLISCASKCHRSSGFRVAIHDAGFPVPSLLELPIAIVKSSPVKSAGQPFSLSKAIRERARLSWLGDPEQHLY